MRSKQGSQHTSTHARKRRPLAGGLSVALALAALAAPVAGQGPIEVFRSTQSALLPTATTIPSGNFMFEISHRFDQSISAGVDALWGFDGTVRNRLGFAYQPTRRLRVGVIRTNLDDNLELGARYTLWDGEPMGHPVAVGVAGSFVWNTDPQPTPGTEDNESQLYLLATLNARPHQRVAVGVVPAYLRNPRIRDEDYENAVALGIHAEVDLRRSIALIGEWIVSESQLETPYDSGTFGFEFTTRGHAFKVLVTNQARMNVSQALAGSRLKFSPDNFRFGFNITRQLAF